jgi:transcription factor TGA
MGIYERQRHLVAAGVWGEPFRPDADAVALPLPAVVPTVTLAPPALDVVVEAEEVKFGKRLVMIIQAPSPGCCVAAPYDSPPSPHGFR